MMGLSRWERQLAKNNLEGRSGVAGPLRAVARYITRRLAIHENITHRDGLRVGRGVVISSPHGLRIGHSVSIGPRTIIQVDGEIGDFALIGMGVQIVGRNDHATDEVGVPVVLSTWVADRDPTPKDRVSIGRDVWIGGSSVVMSGVSIGEGSIIGAGSVVTKDVPPFSIAAGNPARVVRSRFPDPMQSQQHRAALDELSRAFHQ